MNLKCIEYKQKHIFSKHYGVGLYALSAFSFVCSIYFNFICLNNLLYCFFISSSGKGLQVGLFSWFVIIYCISHRMEMETKMNNKRYIKQIWTETERERERGGWVVIGQQVNKRVWKCF